MEYVNKHKHHLKMDKNQPRRKKTLLFVCSCGYHLWCLRSRVHHMLLTKIPKGAKPPKLRRNHSWYQYCFNLAG